MKMFIIGKRKIGTTNYITLNVNPAIHNGINSVRIETERLAMDNPGYEYIWFEAVGGLSTQPVYQIKNVEFT